MFFSLSPLVENWKTLLDIDLFGATVSRKDKHGFDIVDTYNSHINFAVDAISANNREYELGWVSRLTKVDPSSCSKVELIEMLEGLDILQKDQKFQLIDMIFASLNVSEISSEILVGLTRNTYPIRSQLEQWKELTSRTFKILSDRGLDANKAMRGLI